MAVKKFDVPTLIIHGDDDQIVPIAAAALFSGSGVAMTAALENVAKKKTSRAVG